MRPYILAITFITLTSPTFAQNEMETGCIKRIKDFSSKTNFPKFTGLTSVSKDTIKFDRSCIIVSDINTDLSKIFELGLLFPDLIYGASTMGDKYEFKETFSIDTLTISSLSELYFPNQRPGTKSFKFLLWHKMMANPSLYLFELTNSDPNSQTSIKTFLQKAKVTAFGFCSILI